MEKELLVTISDETTCLFGVRFLGSFFQNKSLVNLTLLYIAAHRGTSDFRRSGSEDGAMALEESRKILCHWGFSAEKIKSKIHAREFGIAKDIIREGREGVYDSVVLGKRGYGALQNLFCDSVTRKLMEGNIDFPIWISRLPEEDRRNVLLCVDGSDASLRIADHVGFMVKEEDHVIRVLHVDTGQGNNVEMILNAAREKLIVNGIPEARMEMTVIRSHGVVQTILTEADRGDYAVVAVGRVGHQKGGISGWLIGSRSMRLLEHLEKAVLWVSK